MNKNDVYYVQGATGLVGSAIVRRLKANGIKNILAPPRKQLDLRIQEDVSAFFENNKPDYVFMAAGTVGGIHANKTRPAEFIYDNLMIESNTFQSAHNIGVKKLIYIGSSCAYPKYAEQPIKEESLLTGSLEPTNEPFSIAKIAGIKMAQSYKRQYGDNFIACMPSNQFGINDDFNPETAHVLSSLITKFDRAKSSPENAPVILWGTGSPLREFTFTDDTADAILFLMEHYDGEELINIGSGDEISIRDLADIIKNVTGYTGEVVFDESKPDGMPRRVCDCSKLKALGWSPLIGLEKGIDQVYQWYLENIAEERSNKC